MLLPLIAIILGFALLIWSADRFVAGASGIARNLGISPLIIGLTIVGFGTSAPEMLISVFASIDGKTGMAVGNAVGSNIANIALILGATALISPLTVTSQTLRREFPVLIGVMFASALILLDRQLTLIDGLCLLSGLILIMYWLVHTALRARVGDSMSQDYENEIPAVGSGSPWLWFIIGLLVLLASSKALVWGAVEIAQMLGVSDLVIGLTIVAVGTSMPELAASVVSAIKKESDIAIGNIIGSNLFNTLGVLAVPGLIHPAALPDNVIFRDYPVMLALTVLLFLMAYGFRHPGRINRVEGGVLLICFFAYQALIFYSVDPSA